MKWVKRILVAVVLLAVGFAGGGIVVSIAWHRMLSLQHSVVLIETAADARQLQSGEAEKVLERKSQAIPGMVRILETEHRRYLSKEQYNGALWVVGRFYEETKTPIPSSILPILEAVPPRPPSACSLKQQGQQEEENGE